MKDISASIGKDHFGINRVYIPVESLPKETKIDTCCADCGKPSQWLVVNLVDLTGKGGEEKITAFFYCGKCEVG